ncbi:MAG: Hypothetical protein BHV28_16640 [Candidatus Tokpelaia hoelldobleri]|uniref:Transposase n=1 Tax=Candidatus Tokpelaia hoelldobleri TaxID=1902579 RepID=A0A1U9JWV4_9HYPH|nr:MAG: Hypothetical protein BHV28_16640 [Candidatus Tokpelaia hoelldoblerii]
MSKVDPFKYFKTSSAIIRLAVMYYVRYPLSFRQVEDIRLAVMYYVRYPLSFRQVEDILHERGIDVCHETIRYRVNRFGSGFAGSIRRKRTGHHSGLVWLLPETAHYLPV